MIEVEMIKNDFIVDEKGFQSLNSKGFGKKSNTFNSLDIYEAAFLLEKGKIEIKLKNRDISFEDIKRNKNFDMKEYITYKDLKSKGYQVKSGIKYGFSFRVYDKGIKEGEDHSLWLVKVVGENEKEKIRDLAGNNRVANSTRKKMILSIVDNEYDVTYIEMNWKRM